MPITKPGLKIIAKAVQFLKTGQLVAFPTETVYGLGADAGSTNALKRLYEAKGRPGHHPVIVHLAGFEQISDWASRVPPEAKLLAGEFWPGPLTLVLQRSSKASDLITGGQDTIALRIPRHPLALELLQAFADGVAAPSANRFGHVSPTTAEHVCQEFGDQIAMVLDGGSCDVGIESTIVDLSSARPKILRPGMISSDQIAEILEIGDPQDLYAGENVVRVPGSLPRHYATRTPLQLMTMDQMVERFQSKRSKQTDGGRSSFAVMSFQDQPSDLVHNPGEIRRWIKASTDLTEYARTLYSNLRQLDTSGATEILVEQLPIEMSWLAITDRLMRAATDELTRKLF